MKRTLRIGFQLKNTYRVNTILYAMKQIPLVKRVLPEKLYAVRGMKWLAYGLAGLWELVTIFGGKGLYFLLMVTLPALGLAGDSMLPGRVMLHSFLFLTVIGAMLNTYMFNPTRDKYYAMILLGMDARKYALVHYGYSLGKVALGFLVWSLALVGPAGELPLWLCLLIPLYGVGMKLVAAAWELYRYEKDGAAYNENKPDGLRWGAVAVLLGLSYGLPALKMTMPLPVSAAIMGLAAVGGALSVRRLVRFEHYRAVYQEILTAGMQQMDQAKTAVQDNTRKVISADAGVTSDRKGFEYLNELFIRRHQRILWRPARRIAVICAGILAAAAVALLLIPEAKEPVNRILMQGLPYFTFIMYAINRGSGFTQALFINCDHSLLTYAFYRKPGNVLRLFYLRLVEIVKINLLPGSILGAGMAALLFLSGGTENGIHYLVWLISIPAMSVFFSVHYLTIYYLLQPYNAGSEIKSGMYQVIATVTYGVCWGFMQVQLPTMAFGLAVIGFCLLYCIVAGILVYRLAPRTFKIRM